MKLNSIKIKHLLAVFFLASSLNVQGADKPNVVIIYGDDVGYGDVGVYGSELIPTPNIDALAKRGIRFTDGHSSASTCTPSRFSLLTGVHGFRHGVRVLPPNAPLSIPQNILTLPKLFQQAGYHTGIVGKWHLGIGEEDKAVDWNSDVKPGPLEIGFDSSFLLPSTNDRVPTVYLDQHKVLNLDPKDPLYVGQKNKKPAASNSTAYPDGKKTPEAMTFYKSTHGHNNSVINGIGRIGYMAGGKSALWDDATMSDFFVDRARDYKTSHKDEPFFLYFASQDIHVPRVPHPRFRGKTKLGYRGDAMVQFDWSVGQILKALDDAGVTDNTLVIFSSDNGPVYDDGYDDGTRVRTSTKEVDQGHDASAEFRGGKYQIYEGGTRVPFLVSWPAKIKPGVSNALVNQIDFIASFAQLLNIPLDSNSAVDSRNILPALLGKTEESYDYMVEESTKNLGLRYQQWKFVRGQYLKKKKKYKPNELYNLADDRGEQHNIIKQKPELAQSLAAKLSLFEQGGRVRVKSVKGKE